ncbi:MAG TPA: translation initiation factor IF-3 [Polyangiaceae bacterium]|nr:translation initiation factor IF-3 [Polyangiaceae bacterium]
MAMNRRPPPRDTRAPQVRVNHRIRVPEVRVILDDGTMLGVMTTQEALRAASERGLDLVEVNPKSVPPVCKILDFGKYKYEEKKKASEAKRKQTVIELKEIKLRPKTDDHDLEVKLRAARRFVESGNKVKFTVRFRGREITHPERAQLPLEWLVKNTEDLCNVEQRPTMEGRAMSLIIVPKPQVMQRLATQRAQKVHDDPRKVDDDVHEELHEPDDDDDDDMHGDEPAPAV